ncbi:uncharacterized protein METZ01_LOCUS393522 [marine metagenome]|jgi:hypothetical protein|uniref:Uncharacterized protein n=1 Tax=marine metagenome TaxID=408172 RepID=A0A382V418_9ZZZZ
MLPILECARCGEIIIYTESGTLPGYKNCKCGALQTTLTAAGYVTISVDPSEYKISWPEEEE